MRKNITIVGCGPGAAELLTEQARLAASEARVLIGAKRLLELFADLQCEKISCPARATEACELIARQIANGPVTVLVTGDPMVFSLGQSVVKYFGRERCEILPGLSSVQLAFARLGRSWVGAKIISAHGRQPEVATSELVKYDCFAVLAGTRDAIIFVAELEAELSGSYDVYACENLSLTNELVVKVTAEELAKDEFASLGIMIFVRRNEIETDIENKKE